MERQQNELIRKGTHWKEHLEQISVRREPIGSSNHKTKGRCNIGRTGRNGNNTQHILIFIQYYF